MQFVVGKIFWVLREVYFHCIHSSNLLFSAHLDQLTMNTHEMTENRRTTYPEMYQSSRMYITHGAVEEGSSHPLTLCPPPLKKTLVINWINLHEHLAWRGLRNGSSNNRGGKENTARLAALSVCLSPPFCCLSGCFAVYYEKPEATG